MGFSSTVQSNQTSGPRTASMQPGPQINPLPTDGASGNLPSGYNGAITYSATSGQPSLGAPNPYPNTVGQWDNQTQIDPVKMIGKGA